MKRFLLLFFMSFNTVYGYLPTEEEFQPLVRDVKEIDMAEQELPRNYRTTQDKIDVDDKNLDLRLDGLKELLMGGSAQFTESQLRGIISNWNTKVLVVDLREETHLILETSEGKQIPISAFIPSNLGNQGKSIEEINFEHLRYRNHILEQGVISLPYGKGEAVEVEDNIPVFQVSNVFTEQEIVEKLNDTSPLGVEYVYLPITDHRNPSLQIVDKFLEVMKSAKSNREMTLLFHCRAGRGRTGMMMVMTDILENAKKYDLTLEQILKRQELLGSPDFATIDEEKPEQSKERYEFISYFYQFALADDGYEVDASYSSWREAHPFSQETYSYPGEIKSNAR